MPFRFLVARSETPEERHERRQAAGASAAERYAALLRRLEPSSRSAVVSCVDDDRGRSLAWMLGLDDELPDAGRRTLEIRNFDDSLPNRA